MPIEGPSCLLAKMGNPKTHQYGRDGCHFSLSRDVCHIEPRGGALDRAVEFAPFYVPAPPQRHSTHQCGFHPASAA